MDAATLEAPSFLDLLARRWRLAAPVEACAFTADGRRAAFALADGSLALGPSTDEEPVTSRRRVAVDSGRVTISARRRPVPAPEIVAVDEAPLRLAPAGPGALLAGGAGGRVVRVTGAGMHGLLATLSGAIAAVVPVAGGDVVLAGGDAVQRCDRAGGLRAVLDAAGPLGALAVTRDGDRLAVAGARGVILADLAEAEAAPVGEPLDLGDVVALAWSPDGRHLAAGLAEGAVVLLDTAARTPRVVARQGNYPAPVISLGWTRDGTRLATAGAFRTIVWEVGAAPLAAVATGQARFLVTERVAVHPRRPLVAAGLANGAVVVAEIGRTDELVVKPPGDGAVTALAWAPGGEGLALGTDGGLAAVVELPEHLFK